MTICFHSILSINHTIVAHNTRNRFISYQLHGCRRYVIATWTRILKAPLISDIFRPEQCNSIVDIFPANNSFFFCFKIIFFYEYNFGTCCERVLNFHPLLARDAFIQPLFLSCIILVGIYFFRNVVFRVDEGSEEKVSWGGTDHAPALDWVENMQINP